MEQQQDQHMCQSCGMPLTEEALCGTEKGGAKSREYCVYCYEEGQFKQPEMTLEEMVDLCVPHIVAEGQMDEGEAREMMTKYLPTLKRWR
ncbi:zinc ribbon domain-containing protein [Numidum massiliense]|uniref:zinc ribbon domain-containing protein n=1 Tax=Numidum massiliense TaxID=1522315 RepID=UPI0006D5462D|nr:zinc ribbon domain-containing protein [Numidum massiliense]